MRQVLCCIKSEEPFLASPIVFSRNSISRSGQATDGERERTREFLMGGQNGSQMFVAESWYHLVWRNRGRVEEREGWGDEFRDITK